MVSPLFLMGKTGGTLYNRVMNILVTDASYGNALAVVRACGKAGHHVFTLGFSNADLASFSRYCYRHIVIPSYDDETCIKSLLPVLAQNEIELIIPVGAASVAFFSTYKLLLPQKTQTILPPEDGLLICRDRKKLVNVAIKCGVPVPQSWFFESYQELCDGLKDVHYPAVIKSRWESSGKIPVTYVESQAEVLAFFEGKVAGQWMIQKKIEGEGAGFFAVYNHGKCGLTFQHRRIREWPPTGGISTAAEAIFDEKLLDYGKKLLDELQWNGVAMVEFKRTSEGPSLIEINPKFWGSLDLALYCDVPFPLALIDIANGVDVPFSSTFRKRRFHWPLLELKHLKERPQSLWAILKDAMSPFVGSNLCRFWDPAYFVCFFNKGER
jgi:predicted ATP-grasp superfamily ATP-dependent carboligase